MQLERNLLHPYHLWYYITSRAILPDMLLLYHVGRPAPPPTISPSSLQNTFWYHKCQQHRSNLQPISGMISSCSAANMISNRVLLCSSNMQSIAVVIACTVNGRNLRDLPAQHWVSDLCTRISHNNPEVHFITHVGYFYAHSLMVVLLQLFSYYIRLCL